MLSFFSLRISNEKKTKTNKSLLQHMNYVRLYVPRGVTYYDKTIRIDKNPIKTALNVCKYLISQRVYAVVVSHESSGDLSPAAVSYTCGFYQIPVIGISSRDAAFSDKNIHVSFCEFFSFLSSLLNILWVSHSFLNFLGCWSSKYYEVHSLCYWVLRSKNKRRKFFQGIYEA